MKCFVVMFCILNMIYFFLHICWTSLYNKRKGLKVSSGGKIFAHFPSIGSDDPPGVENVKIRENFEKIRGPPTTLLGP